MGSSPELDEKNFIQEHGPKFIWSFLVFFILFIALMWGIDYWQRDIEQDLLQNSTFYQVTNRDFSIFLWQNPRFMRTKANLTEAYLPHFHTRDQIHVIPELADEYVVAPPDILYRYHTWNRLLGGRLSGRPIFQESFLQFLNENPEWEPQYWDKAPPEYVELIGELQNARIVDLTKLSLAQLPLRVRQAYEGWFNFTREWGEIGPFFPTKKQVRAFLKENPHYARNYWRNLFPDYLIHLDTDESLKEADVPVFLKIAIFNSVHQQNRPHR